MDFCGQTVVSSPLLLFGLAPWNLRRTNVVSWKSEHDKSGLDMLELDMSDKAEWDKSELVMLDILAGFQLVVHIWYV